MLKYAYNGQWSITTNYQKNKLHQTIKQLVMLQKGFKKKILLTKI